MEKICVMRTHIANFTHNALRIFMRKKVRILRITHNAYAHIPAQNHLPWLRLTQGGLLLQVSAQGLFLAYLLAFRRRRKAKNKPKISLQARKFYNGLCANNILTKRILFQQLMHFIPTTALSIHTWASPG